MASKRQKTCGSDQPAELVLALDVGSSSVRCSAFRVASNGAAPTVSPVPDCASSAKMWAVQPNTGRINIQLSQESGNGAAPTCSLFDKIDSCVDSVLVKLRRHYATEKLTFAVCGVAFSTFAMNLVGVDADGKPVSNEATMTYACNTPEVARECEALRNTLGHDRLHELHQRTGAPIHSAYALPQLRVFYRDNATLAKSVHRWQTLASICIERWTRGTSGRIQPRLPLSYSEASWTGMFKFRDCQWCDIVKDLLPPESLSALPDPSDYDEQAMRISESSPYFDRWPELRGDACQFFLGIGDGACANIGSKCSTLNRIAVTVGTSAAARIVLPLPLCQHAALQESGHDMKVPPGLFSYRISRHHILIGGALNDGGSIVEWLRSILKLESDEDFEAAMSRITEKYSKEQGNASSALITAPFLSGERSTGYRVGATGVLSGITRETTSDDLIQSAFEGVVLRLGAILCRITDARRSLCDGTESQDVIASGNALVPNSLWKQMLADCSGLKVLVDDLACEATSRGAALAAAMSLKQAGTFHDETVEVLSQAVPNKAAKEKWAAKAAAQENLIDAMCPLWK